MMLIHLLEKFNYLTIADSKNWCRIEINRYCDICGTHLIHNSNMNSHCVYAINHFKLNVYFFFQYQKN